MQENQNNQHQQFTQSQLQQLKSLLSRNIENLEKKAGMSKGYAQAYKDVGDKVNKDVYFSFMQLQLNKAKKLAKLQKKVKNLISGKESS